jgi:hypothetical protein
MNEKDGADPKGNGTNDLLSKPAYSLPYDAVVAELGSRIEEGLSDDEAGRRLQHYGPNKIEEGEGVSLTKISVRQVANAMMLVKPPIFLQHENYTSLTCFYAIGPNHGHGCQFRHSIVD